MDTINDIKKALQFAWQFKEDIESWESFEEHLDIIKNELPEFYKAWITYKSAKNNMDIICRDIGKDIDWMT